MTTMMISLASRAVRRLLDLAVEPLPGGKDVRVAGRVMNQTVAQIPVWV